MEKSPSKVKGTVTRRPWGGVGGYAFDDGTYTGIRQINLSRNVAIVWIRVLYDFEGETIWGCKQGGTGGLKNDKVKSEPASKFRLLYLIIFGNQND